MGFSVDVKNMILFNWLRAKRDKSESAEPTLNEPMGGR